MNNKSNSSSRKYLIGYKQAISSVRLSIEVRSKVLEMRHNIKKITPTIKSTRIPKLAKVCSTSIKEDVLNLMISSNKVLK